MAGDLDVSRTLELAATIARERDGRHVIVGGSDPTIERHHAELFGAPVEPDFSPIDTRYVPPKTALVEWIGDPSPFDSELIRALRLRDLLLPVERLVLGQLTFSRQPRIDGYTSWALGPRDGLTKTYRWGPQRGTYVVEVDFADIDNLLDLGDWWVISGTAVRRPRNAFRILGSHADALPPQGPDDAYWARVINRLRRKALHIDPLTADQKRLRVRAGAEQPLVGIDRTGTVGTWRV
jgi:hypothetical protein